MPFRLRMSLRRSYRQAVKVVSRCSTGLEFGADKFRGRILDKHPLGMDALYKPERDDLPLRH